jgi:truncated hemoglobin YjbI
MSESKNHPLAPSSLMRIQLQAIIRSLGPDLDSQTLKLNSILEDFYERMHSDTMLGYFFIGKDLKHIAHQQGQFLLNAAGMIPKFEGKGPHSAHTALPPIWEGHFDRRITLLRETLIHHGLAAPMMELWIAFESSFRNIVVSK